MVARTHFIAQDYPLAFDLQSLFQKYVTLYTELNFPEDKEVLTGKDRHDLSLKLLHTKNEISLRVLQMKHASSENDMVKGNLRPPYPHAGHERRMFN